jgi:hypothetical protein
MKNAVLGLRVENIIFPAFIILARHGLARFIILPEIKLLLWS